MMVRTIMKIPEENNGMLTVFGLLDFNPKNNPNTPKTTAKAKKHKVTMKASLLDM